MIRFIIKSLSVFLFVSAINAQQKDTLRLDLVGKDLPFGLTQKEPSSTPKIGIALSGGGARSISQLGLLRALEERNIPIEYIVGTSMGSIIGGLYSAGYSLDELDSVVINTRWDDLFSADQSDRNELFIDRKITEDRAILAFRMDGFKPIIPKSISSGQRGATFLNLLSLNAPIKFIKNYDNYKFKYRAISTDLISGKEIILDKGPLGLSMQASSSVTLLLPPVKKDSLLLVDGGLVANIPVKETRKLGAEIIIAGNTSSPLYTESELSYPWVIADQLVSIPMQILNEQQLEEADFIIQPKLEGRKNTDFSNIPELIRSGYTASLPVVDLVEKEFERKFKYNLNIKEKFYKGIIILEAPEKTKVSIQSKFTQQNFISNKELLYQLYLIQREGNFKDAFIEVEQLADTSFVRIITEKYPILQSYELQGDSLLNVSEITKIIAPLLNKNYSPAKTLEAAFEILRNYKHEGYSLARIEQLLFDEITQTLHLSINEGKIAKIRVSGNSKTKERIITREFPMRGGDFFKFENAEKGLTSLHSTNLFEQIELTVNKEDNQNNLVINVVERPSSVIRFGMRIDNEYFTQLSFDLRDENFNGTGTEIGAIFSGGLRNRSYAIEHRANRVFDSYLTYKVKAFYEFNDVNVYKDDSTKVHNRFSRSKTGEYRQIYYGGSFGIGAQVEKFGNLFVEGRFQQDEIKSKMDYPGPAYKIDITSLKFSLSIDSQNDYPYPTNGFLVKVYYETAQTALGGDIGYAKFSFDYKSITSLNTDHILTFRTVIGFGDETLPLSQQFSFGGHNSFFGLRDNEYRGRQQFLASLEYRYKLPVKLFFDTYLKARYDLGSIWAEKEQIRFKDLRHGVGTTLSFKTPIGPVDFSVGKSFYLRNTLPNNTIVWGPTFFYFTVGYYY